PSHRGDLVLGNSCRVDELPRQASRQRIRRGGRRRPTRRRRPVLHTGPELGLGDIQLVPEDVRPQARSVARGVDGTRDPRPQDPPVRKGELVGDVVASLLAARSDDPGPPLRRAEGVVIASAPPSHAPTSTGDSSPPSTQALSSSSEDSSTSSATARFSVWFGAACRWSFHASAYSRNACSASSTAASNDSPSPCTGRPGKMTAHPPPSATTRASAGRRRASILRCSSARTTTKVSLPRATEVTTPARAASSTSRRRSRAWVWEAKCRGPRFDAIHACSLPPRTYVQYVPDVILAAADPAGVLLPERRKASFRHTVDR